MTPGTTARRGYKFEIFYNTFEGIKSNRVATSPKLIPTPSSTLPRGRMCRCCFDKKQGRRVSSAQSLAARRGIKCHEIRPRRARAYIYATCRMRARCHRRAGKIEALFGEERPRKIGMKTPRRRRAAAQGAEAARGKRGGVGWRIAIRFRSARRVLPRICITLR